MEFDDDDFLGQVGEDEDENYQFESEDEEVGSNDEENGEGEEEEEGEQPSSEVTFQREEGRTVRRKKGTNKHLDAYHLLTLIIHRARDLTHGIPSFLSPDEIADLQKRVPYQVEIEIAKKEFAVVLALRSDVLDDYQVEFEVGKNQIEVVLPSEFVSYNPLPLGRFATL